MGKYDEDGPFNDPIVMCDSCQEVEKTAIIKNSGQCLNCGHRKFRNVLVLNERNMLKVQSMNLDPEFLALFEEVELGRYDKHE